MKITIALLAFLPIAVAPAAHAAPAAFATVEAPALRTRFNAAVDALRVKAEARNATRADYQRVIDEFKAAAAAYEVPAPSVFIGERVLARIGDLEVMAQAKMYELLELDILKDQAIDAELEYVINRIKTGIAASRQPSRTDWDAVIATLSARAEAAKSWNPEIDAIIGRLRAEIDALVVKSKAGPITEKDLGTAIDTVKEVRVSNTVARLEKRGLEKVAIDADYKDVVDAAKRIPLPPAESAELVKKVEAKVAELQAMVKAGKITREEFAKLREMLNVRARAASSPK